MVVCMWKQTDLDTVIWACTFQFHQSCCVHSPFDRYRLAWRWVDKPSEYKIDTLSDMLALYMCCSLGSLSLHSPHSMILVLMWWQAQKWSLLLKGMLQLCYLFCKRGLIVGCIAAQSTRKLDGKQLTIIKGTFTAKCEQVIDSSTPIARGAGKTIAGIRDQGVRVASLWDLVGFTIIPASPFVGILVFPWKISWVLFFHFSTIQSC